MGRFLEWWKAPGRYWEDVPESGHAGAGNPGENGSEERKRSGEKRYVTLLKSLLLAALLSLSLVCPAPASGSAAFIVLSGALHRAGAESGEGLYTLLRME